MQRGGEAAALLPALSRRGAASSLRDVLNPKVFCGSVPSCRQHQKLLSWLSLLPTQDTAPSTKPLLCGWCAAYLAQGHGHGTASRSGASTGTASQGKAPRGCQPTRHGSGDGFPPRARTGEPRVNNWRRKRRIDCGGWRLTGIRQQD